MTILSNIEKEHMIIYQLHFNNGTYYIGSTKDLKKRIACHRSRSYSDKPFNKRLARTWRKYGEPSIIVMGTYEQEQDMLEAEQFYLNVSISDKDCLNQNPNADRGGCPKGTKFSDETKRRISESSKGKAKSKEHCNALSLAKSTPVIATDPNGNQTVFTSTVDCAEKLGFIQSTVARLILTGKCGRCNKQKGWTFRRLEK